MKRLTTGCATSNFEVSMNYVFGKDGWAHIISDGEHENVPLTSWAKAQCIKRGCDEFPGETPEEIDQTLCDCLMDGDGCPVALAYCFAVLHQNPSFFFSIPQPKFLSRGDPMPKESLNVYMTIQDGMSPALVSIADKTKALDKETQQLQATYKSLQEANKTLIDRKVELQGKVDCSAECTDTCSGGCSGSCGTSCRRSVIN